MRSSDEMPPPEEIPASTWLREVSRASGGGGGGFLKPESWPEGTNTVRHLCSKVLVPTPSGQDRVSYFPEFTQHAIEDGDWIIGTCPDRHAGRFCKACTAMSRLPPGHELLEFGNSPTRRNNVGWFYNHTEGALKLYRFPDSVRKGIASKGKIAAQLRPPVSITDPYRGYDLEVTKGKKKGKVEYSVEMVPQAGPMIILPDGSANVATIKRIVAEVKDLNPIGNITDRDFENIDRLVKAIPDLWNALTPQERAWSHTNGTVGPSDDNSQEPDYGNPEDEDAPPPSMPASIRSAAAVPPPQSTTRTAAPQPQRISRPDPAPPPASTAPASQGRIQRPQPKPSGAPPANTAPARAVDAMNQSVTTTPGFGSEDDIPF